MDLDETLVRVKQLITQRERIDAELASLVKLPAKRGRPRKDEAEIPETQRSEDV